MSERMQAPIMDYDEYESYDNEYGEELSKLEQDLISTDASIGETTDPGDSSE